MAIQKWPYTNLHDLNLDWILNEVKTLRDQLEDYSLYFPHISEYNDGIWTPDHNYQPNEIVIAGSDLYIAKAATPTGISINNTKYWLKVASIPSDVLELDDRVDVLEKTKYYVTPEDFGAVGDGVTDDQAAIQAALENENGYNVIFSGKTYLISAPIVIDLKKVTSIELANSIIQADADMPYMVIIKASGGNYIRNVNIKGNGTIDCKGRASSGIHIEETAPLVNIINIEIRNFSDYGILNDAPQCIFTDLRLIATNNTSSTGIKNTATDNQITNCFIYRTKIGMEIMGDIINDLHTWIDRDQSSVQIATESIGIIAHLTIYAGTLYLDACSTAIYADANSRISISNLIYLTDKAHSGIMFNADATTYIRLGQYVIGDKFTTILPMHTRNITGYPAPQNLYGRLIPAFPNRTGKFDPVTLFTPDQYTTPFFGTFASDTFYIIGYLRKSTGKAEFQIGTNDFTATLQANLSTAGTDTFTLVRRYNTGPKYIIAFGTASNINDINVIPILLKSSEQRPFQYTNIKENFTTGAGLLMPCMRRDIADMPVYTGTLLTEIEITWGST